MTTRRTLKLKRCFKKFKHWIKSILFFSAGLERKIYTRYGFRVEHGKYVTIGLLVLLTGVFAGFSGGYAFYNVFYRKNLAILLGLLWGFLILNLDRLVVLGINKPNLKYADSSTLTPVKNDTVSRLRGGMGILTRILLACTLGFIISEPIKLTIFKPRIDRQILTSSKQKQISDADNRLKKLREKEKSSENDVKNSRGDVEKEFNNTARPGYGNMAEKLEGYVEKDTSELETIRENIQIEEKAIKKLQDESIQIGLGKGETLQQVSLCDQIYALHKLESEDEFIKTISLFITFLFVLIELVPVIAKLSIGPGKYEDLLIDDAEKYHAERRERHLKMKLVSEVNQHFRDIVYAASETEKTQAEEDFTHKKDLFANSLKSRLERHNIRIKAESDQLKQFQDMIDEFRNKVLTRVLNKANLEIADKVNDAGRQYGQDLSQQVTDLLTVFQNVYNEVSVKRLSIVQDNARKDVTDEFDAFEKNLREIRTTHLKDIATNAGEFAKDGAASLSEKAANNMSEMVSRMIDEMDTALTKISAENHQARESGIREDFDIYIKELDKELNEIRDDTIKQLLNLTDDKLSVEIKSLASEIVEKLKKQIMERMNEVLNPNNGQD